MNDPMPLVGFILFAAIESLSWLHLNVTKPFKNESIDLRNTYASPVEQDEALLLRWLPSQGKVGYLSEKQGLPRFESKLHLAPLLLDSNWTQYDWVLVDYPVRQGLAEIESPRYQLVVNLPDAKTFAKGMRIGSEGSCTDYGPRCPGIPAAHDSLAASGAPPNLAIGHP